jgi:catechol 2,3-dioxygenase-like lactoylglutathione lyase family enzyme
MIMNHMGLGVTEVPATVAMFETYFGLRRAEGAPQTDKMGFLRDDAGALITIFKVPDATYPKIFHIGFMRDSVDEVHAMHARLTADGFNPQPVREEHGRITFYFMAPGGFTVEFNSLKPGAFA